jgi:flagellar biosynthesis protein FlhF
LPSTSDRGRSRLTSAASATFQRLLCSLVDVETPEPLSRELAGQVMRKLPQSDWDDWQAAWPQLVETVSQEIEVAGPIHTVPRQRRLVALVGPTGVGKTTTIAKLAANFRLREHRRVGLITVDTYRIAAVEQVRTYAQIIDLPMEVVSTPQEMQQAVARLADLDLILMDTAGRSPRDEMKIHDLQSLLAEAQPDEVHLVLSCTSSATALARSSECFAEIGANRLILTKLDEAQGLGNLLPLFRASRLPLSYVTHGQNVPDDIEIANSARLAQQILESSEVPVG